MHFILSKYITRFASFICSFQCFVIHVKNLYLQEGEFDWSEAQQMVIFGTYFWGQVVSQIPAGWMTSRLTARVVMPTFMLMTSATTVLIPVAARTHYFILILLRFLGGVGAVGTLPPFIL